MKYECLPYECLMSPVHVQSQLTCNCNLTNNTVVSYLLLKVQKDALVLLRLCFNKFVQENAWNLGGLLYDGRIYGDQ